MSRCFPKARAWRPAASAPAISRARRNWPKNAACPIAPVALNSGRLWGKNAFRKIPGVITVRVGRAIETENATTKEITESARRWIESQTADLAR